MRNSTSSRAGPRNVFEASAGLWTACVVVVSRLPLTHSARERRDKGAARPFASYRLPHLLLSYSLRVHSAHGAQRLPAVPPVRVPNRVTLGRIRNGPTSDTSEVAELDGIAADEFAAALVTEDQGRSAVRDRAAGRSRGDADRDVRRTPCSHWRKPTWSWNREWRRLRPESE